MKRIYSNGISGDYVRNPFEHLLFSSTKAHLAAPYFTDAKPILEAARAGKSIELLIGLNASTSPYALTDVFAVPNVTVRYLTHRFHAKIYLFDDDALLGSSNLTDGGLMSNREAVICLDRPEDRDAVEEIRAVFKDLWDSGRVLTADVLKKFRQAWGSIKTPNPDEIIEDAVGRAEPRNINVDTWKQDSTRNFLEEIRREIYGQYGPAFSEVSRILEEHNYRRPELADVGRLNETNRFLNWVRLTYVVGDDAWRDAPLRTEEGRKQEILRFGQEWAATDASKIPEDFTAMLLTVRRVFGTAKGIESASQAEITEGLLSIHAFLEQLRFTKGGLANLSTEFWRENTDMKKVKRTLTYLIHESGDFAERLHDVLYRPDLKLVLFGRFCAMELFGTIRPEECPPVNGRMAKALRYLGFDVRTT